MKYPNLSPINCSFQNYYSSCAQAQQIYLIIIPRSKERGYSRKEKMPTK